MSYWENNDFSSNIHAHYPPFPEVIDDALVYGKPSEGFSRERLGPARETSGPGSTRGRKVSGHTNQTTPKHEMDLFENIDYLLVVLYVILIVMLTVTIKTMLDLKKVIKKLGKALKKPPAEGDD